MMSPKQPSNPDNSTSKSDLLLSLSRLPQCHLQDEQPCLYWSIRKSYLLSYHHHLWQCRVHKYNNPQLLCNSHLALQYQALAEQLAQEQWLQQVVALLQQLQECPQALMPNLEHPSNDTPIPHPQEDLWVAAVEVAEDQNPLLVHRNLLPANQPQKDKFQLQYHVMLKLWEGSQPSLMEIAFMQMTSLKKSRDSLGLTKMLQDITLQLRKSCSPLPLCKGL